MRFPKSRTEEILSQKSECDLLLYDLKVHKAFCLNETTARVWEECDGETPISEIASRHGMPPEVVTLAVEQLSKENLLTEKINAVVYGDRISRRRVVAAASALGVALPVISAMVVPTAVHAQSGACVNDGANLVIADQPTQKDCTDALAMAVPSGCCSGQASLFVYGTLSAQSCFAVCGMVVG